MGTGWSGLFPEFCPAMNRVSVTRLLAALIWLMIALPTRAAASQIQRRIHRAVQASFGAECVLALPGYLKAGDATGAALPGGRALGVAAAVLRRCDFPAAAGG